MKCAFAILIFVVLAQLCLATENSKLPEEPWRAIVGTNYFNLTRWHRDIKIKLLNYTEEDSLMVKESISFLSELVESISIGFCENDSINLELYFSNDINKVESQYDPFYDNNEWSKRNGMYSFIFSMKIDLDSVPSECQQNYITNKLAFSLFPKYLFENESILKKLSKKKITNSIFIRNASVNLFYQSMQDFDKAVIKALFSNNYNVDFEIAKKQFLKFYIPEWLRDHSHEILVFPFVLVVFLLVGLFVVVYRKLFSHIRNKWLQYNAILVFALPILGILISVYFMSALKLKYYPYVPNFYLSNFLAGILTITILGLPALNLIRLIEVVTHRNTKQKFFRVLLLFLSTSLIPSGTLLAIAYFVNDKNLRSYEIRAILIGFLVFTIIGIIRALISFFILKEKEIKIENEVKLANLRELKTRAELNALHSKINPHFLYNSLNSIAGLAKTSADKTEHMALSLSKLFRYSINKEQSDWSTLAEELEMVNVYLDIEKVRFDDRLEFSIDLAEELKSLRIPQFLIQPLAENALKHGISKLVSKGIVKISVRKVDQWIEIEVADNGPGFPNELNPGFGLQSIYDKLEILYPNRFELHFLNSPNKHILIKLA